MSGSEPKTLVGGGEESKRMILRAELLIVPIN